MKSSHLFRYLLVVLCAVVFSGIVNIASAQSAESSTLKWHQIPVHNVSVQMMMHIIDPAQHSIPEEYQSDQAFPNAYSFQDNSENPASSPYAHFGPSASKQTTADFQKHWPNVLLAPDDLHKILWVRCDDMQFGQLQQIVKFLDRPSHEIHCTVNLVEIDPQDMAAFDVKYEYPQDNPASKEAFAMLPPRDRYGTVLSDFKATLDKLVAAGKAKIIFSDQKAKRSDLTAIFSTSQSSPVSIDVVQNGDHLALPATNNTLPIFREQKFIAIVTPTFVDGHIQLFVTGRINTFLTHNVPAKENDSLFLQGRQQLTTVFTIEDGETIVRNGMYSKFIGLDDSTHNVVFFVTANIVK